MPPFSAHGSYYPFKMPIPCMCLCLIDARNEQSRCASRRCLIRLIKESHHKQVYIYVVCCELAIAYRSRGIVVLSDKTKTKRARICQCVPVGYMSTKTPLIRLEAISAMVSLTIGAS